MIGLGGPLTLAILLEHQLSLLRLILVLTTTTVLTSFTCRAILVQSTNDAFFIMFHLAIDHKCLTLYISYTGSLAN